MSVSITGLSLPEFRGVQAVTQMFTGGGRYAQPSASGLVSESYKASTVGLMNTFQTTQVTPWSVQLSANIERLRRLAPGWDGPRSLPINNSLLNRVNVLIRESLTPVGIDARPPFVVPLPSGGVQVEWHTVQGELEFELAADGTAAVWVRDHSTGHEFETEGAKAINQFLFWAPRLAQRQLDVADVSSTTETSIFSVAA